MSNKIKVECTKCGIIKLKNTTDIYSCTCGATISRVARENGIVKMY